MTVEVRLGHDLIQVKGTEWPAFLVVHFAALAMAKICLSKSRLF